MFHKVMVGEDCFGRGTQAECEGIIRMHKNSRVNGKGDTKASTLDFKIVSVEGDYPSEDAFTGRWKLPSLGYKPGGSSILK